MTTKQDKVLSVALELFNRYGFKKVSLGEIAEAAGISRPTLYSFFANKGALIERLAYQAAIAKREETEVAISKAGTIQQQLEVVFRIWVLDAFEQFIDDRQSPDWLVEARLQAPEANEVYYQEMEQVLLALLQSHLSDPAPITATHLAAVMTQAARGYKTAAKNMDEIKQLSSGLIVLAMQVLDR